MKDRIILFLVLNGLLFIVPLVASLTISFVAWDVSWLENYVIHIPTLVKSSGFRLIELGIVVFSIAAW